MRREGVHINGTGVFCCGVLCLAIGSGRKRTDSRDGGCVIKVTKVSPGTWLYFHLFCPQGNWEHGFVIV